MMIGEKRPSKEFAARIKDEFLATGDSTKALAERTALVDGLVREAFEELLAPLGSGLAVLAVGGYGRRQLFPYSDVDLLLLFDNERLAEANRESIASFLQRLWDADLRVSHSVRTPAECSELQERNTELHVSLLDQRFLTGHKIVYARLAERLPRFIHGHREDLVRNLSRLARERYQKFHNTYYHLEPNIKETPGGLRDLQLICWLDQIRRTGSDRMALAETPAELQDAQRFLARLRCFLHYQAGRDNNIFTFDAQETVAKQWQRSETAEWMRNYFRHARGIHRLAVRALESSEAQVSSLFSSFRDWRARLSNAEFTVSRERVHFRVPQQLEADAELLLRLFEFVARHRIPLSAEAEQRILARLPQVREYFFTHSRPLWPALREILQLPHAHVALRAMHETGVLRAIFPEMEQIECLVIRDFYHRYTVDEHTLVTIQTLAELRDKRYADVYSELEKPGLLAFALLFHDVGKGSPRERHVPASLRVAEVALERIQMPPEDREMVRFLIRHHLEMSATVNSRDLFDPATAQYMAHLVGTVERLRSLTLMTYADISAVHPGAMTPWRAEQLWQLYLLTYNELTRTLETERIESVLEAPFLEGLPTRYLRTHSSEEIEEHARLVEAGQKRGVAVELLKCSGGYRLTLAAGDRPFLFASVAGTLSSFGLNILKAEAFSNRAGVVLDTFTFADPLRTLELNPTEVDRLRLTLERVVLGKADVRQLLQNRPKAAPPSRKARVQPSVSFDAEASTTATLIQIVAQDRPGLLYDLASAISAQGCNIEVVLIDTEAHKAIDVFYVTAGGGKLDAQQQDPLEQALRAACQ